MRDVAPPPPRQRPLLSVMLYAFAASFISHVVPSDLTSTLSIVVNFLCWFYIFSIRSTRDPTFRVDAIAGLGLTVYYLVPAGSGLLTSAAAFLGLALLPLSLTNGGHKQSDGKTAIGGANVESATESTSRKAYVVPARTTHTRLFPKHHSLSYSYLQVLVPIENETKYGSLLSVGRTVKKSWFHLRPSDFLNRGGPDVSFKAKLSTYLKSEGIADDEWDHAYLSTAPRFLGYSFNPVSFWYIYDAENHLKFMVLEVNNTFDERRMYLLRGQPSSEVNEDVEDSPAGTKINPFRDTWAKDFHVSPFSSRKGAYRLKALDPFANGQVEPPVIDNTITLMSNKGHVKLVARVFSENEAVAGNTVDTKAILEFVARWSWVGFVTFPRIIKEAAVLFFKRGLNVWFRPEVMPSSIGRTATSLEIELAGFVHRYLGDLVEQSQQPMRLSVQSGLPGIDPLLFNSKIDTDHNTPTIKIRVLSPVFYQRFVHYTSSIKAFEKEGTNADDKNRTILVLNFDLLLELLNQDAQGSVHLERKSKANRLKTLRWLSLRRMRCPPAAVAYSPTSKLADLQDLGPGIFSQLDEFMLRTCDDSWQYRRLVTKSFLAQRFAFGFTELIDLLDVLFRLLLVALAVQWVIVPLCSIIRKDIPMTTQEMGKFAASKQFLILHGIHIWAVLKGFEHSKTEAHD